ncbi:branched-chain amino acid transporter permease [Corynebacterium propinquum]|uniref:branched-chain amino acid transporter permease n=1 Tax=Corynebacterium propinquum TaxID=43769 RepID=UPI0025426325|nr:AzlD domain-containing protein [Corynebacterium propinquum]MDK4257645.1 AzlD domain-containing protein [Corynebacterium propinquum]MDK4281707.1 AzlD domain-containing protein [Corynebacterium propinquum]MDK4298222.1 AzlD domain-containing protein [Corynebacterium propinquum]
MDNYGLPEGISLSQVLAVLIPVGIVTVVLRQLPFSFIKVMRGSPLVATLAKLMPVGVMVALVIYTIFQRPFSTAVVASTAVGIAATVGLHIWHRSPALSIIGGTAAYVGCINVVF